MVITKDSVAAKIFKEFLVAPKTQKATTVATSVEFYKEKGIVVNLDGSIPLVFIKDKNVDKTCSVQGSFIISVICASLSDTDTNIEFDSDAVVVNGVKFPTNSLSDDRLDSVVSSINTPHITFTKEQLSKIEKDFDVTLENYFVSPTMVDVITFAVNEGNLYKFVSSQSCWKISNVEAEIDKVQLEQDYGHTTKAWTLPHKVFNLAKFSENTKMYFTDYNAILIETNDLYLQFNCRNTKTTKFKHYLNYINSTPETTEKFDYLFKAKHFFENIADNTYELEEDINAVISFTSGKGFKIKVDTGEISFDVPEVSFTKEMELDIAVVRYLLNNISENTVMVSRDNNEIELIDDKAHYFILDFNQD